MKRELTVEKYSCSRSRLSNNSVDEIDSTVFYSSLLMNHRRKGTGSATVPYCGERTDVNLPNEWDVTGTGEVRRNHTLNWRPLNLYSIVHRFIRAHW